MSQPFIGEIRMFGGSFAPVGWAFCSGQLMPISENDALFTLIGTTYGGDGENTFALPNLQSRFPLHQGTGPGLSTYQLGETGGTESVTLTTNQIPNHSHTPTAHATGGSGGSPFNNLWAASTPGTLLYTTGPAGTADTPMNPAAVNPAGGNQPHENMSPFLVVSFIISLFGVYPTQS